MVLIKKKKQSENAIYRCVEGDKGQTGLPFVMDLKDGSESSLILNSSFLSIILLFTHLTGMVDGASNGPWPCGNALHLDRSSFLQ